MNCAARYGGWAQALVLAGGLAEAQTTERVSVDSAGVEANGWSVRPALSADGRFVAFTSTASNLVASDTNGFVDVFLHDRLTGQTELVSVDSAGQQGNSNSSFASNTPAQPGISADGRFVVFQSGATNFFAGDFNGAEDIFVRDRLLGTTECVSVDSNGVLGNSGSDSAVISADGRFVAFRSNATNLVAGDTNAMPDVFVRDRLAGTTERVSISSAGLEADLASRNSALSADGRFVAFTSLAGNLDPADVNLNLDVFVRDRLYGTTELVSVDPSGSSGTGDSVLASISADGRFVTFQSAVSTLVGGDTNGTWDVFQRDLQAHTTLRASLGNAGQQGNDFSYSGGSSVDGRYVFFESFAENLVQYDNNVESDVFVRDVQAATTEIMSVDSFGNEGPLGGAQPSFSVDGRFVAFASASPGLIPADGNQVSDIFVHDRGQLPVAVFCSGDGSGGACPCGNSGTTWRGCENSASTGGARLSSNGIASLSNDTLVLTSGGELPSALSIFLQGSQATAPLFFGDGLRCAGGILKRLYVHSAAGGSVGAPQGGDPSISARSAALGDTLTAGTTRYYQTYYRDPDPSFCPTPSGNTWNISSGLSVVWSQ